MADIKLGKLPDRTPVKLTITITPDLQSSLQAYASVYAAASGAEEPVVDLIHAMLTAFVESERAFNQARADAAGAVNRAKRPAARRVWNASDSNRRSSRRQLPYKHNI